jgi:hypothetical protein
MSQHSQPFFEEVESVDDEAFMVANGAGMDSYDDGKSIHGGVEVTLIRPH